MRRNEILGLQLSDINLDKGYFEIAHQLATTKTRKKTGKMIVDLKEDSSERVLPITKFAKPYFLRQIERLRNAIQDVNLKTYDGFLICDNTGKPLPESHISGNFGRRTKSLGLPDIRFHDLPQT